jgi:hypothetical protein
VGPKQPKTPNLVSVSSVVAVAQSSAIMESKSAAINVMELVAYQKLDVVNVKASAFKGKS